MKYYLLCLTLLSIVAKGQDYFQQEVNYKIQVSLDDRRHVLKANLEFEYINNSKESLDYIIMHLWPNAYANNDTEMAIQSEEDGLLDFYFADSTDRGFIDSLHFMADGANLKFKLFEEHIDICTLFLNKPLAPGKSTTIKTPFRVKLPKGIYSRLGHIGESYQITQWYPKPAVYDNNGWHPLPYLSQGEFFSEYGSFDVSITLPKNYVLGATGDMVNGENERQWLLENVKRTESKLEALGDKYVQPNMDFPPSSKETKTLRFKQSNVHDFAWFADKRYMVLKGEVELPHSKEKVETWAMFTENEQVLWKNSIEYLNDAVYQYSYWNGDYPYKHCTAVDGSISAGGGMEYPNITVISESYSDYALEQVIVHEVGHNWFYGILGSNERTNAWMDEGINQFTENRYTENKYKNLSLYNMKLPGKLWENSGAQEYGPRHLYDLGYLHNARRNLDQSLSTSSENFTSLNYGAMVYGKAAIGFDYLLAYLGDETFDKCMRTYFERWKFKHPNPKDIQNVFEEVSKKSLDWFFGDFIQTTGKINYGIQSVSRKDGQLTITVQNKGDITAPYSFSLVKNDTAVLSTEWNDGHEGTKTYTTEIGDAELVILDYDMDIPELNRTNDLAKTKGFLKKIEPLRFQFLGGIENRRKTTVYWTPTIGWNATNHTMLGTAFYNTTFPSKKTEWMLAPMYSFETGTVAGSAELTHNIYPKSFFRKISLGYKVKSYSRAGYFFSEADQIQWLKEDFVVDFELKNKRGRSKTTKSIKLRSILIYEDEKLSFNSRATSYFNANFRINNRQVFRPASLEFNAISSSSIHLAELTGKKRFNYNKELRGIEFRGYIGLAQNNGSSKYSLQLSGQDRSFDFLYDRTYIGRGQDYPDLLANQFSETQGGFKTSTTAPISSGTFLFALNTKLDLPIGPVKLFADFGGYPVGIASQQATTINFAYDAGIYFTIYKDICEIFIPLFYSDRFNSNFDYKNVSFAQRIRFTFNLHDLNPYSVVRKLEH